MSRFLGSKATLVVVLVSVLVLVVGISVATGAGSGGQNAAAPAESPSLQALPAQVVVAGCSGQAEFDVAGAGWRDGEVVLLSLTTDDRREFIGAGFPGGSGGFVDDVYVKVDACGVSTVRAVGRSGTVNAPVIILETK